MTLAQLLPAHAHMLGRTGYPVRSVHRTTDIAPQGHRNQRKTGRHPPGTHRTADTSPQGIYTPSQPSGYMAHIGHGGDRSDDAGSGTNLQRLAWHARMLRISTYELRKPINQLLGYPHRIGTEPHPGDRVSGLSHVPLTSLAANGDADLCVGMHGRNSPTLADPCVGQRCGPRRSPVRSP
jgi:hypothetical protein